MDEALVNAVKHGNKCDEGKSVHVVLSMDDKRWGLWISDEGCGFCPEDVPDPDQEESLMMESGRGVLLMLEYMDEVNYYSQGRQIMMIKNTGK